MIKRTQAPTEKNSGELWYVDHTPALIQMKDGELGYYFAGCAEWHKISEAKVFHGPVERPEFE